MVFKFRLKSYNTPCTSRMFPGIPRKLGPHFSPAKSLFSGSTTGTLLACTLFLLSSCGSCLIYIRHGGKDVSNYLRDNLHALVESVTPDKIGSVVKWTIDTHGGYFKRWRGGHLQRWTRWSTAPVTNESSGMAIEERLTLAFLQVCENLLNHN